MFHLQIKPAEGASFEYPLRDDSLIVGRAADADVVLSDRFLSRHHARFFRDGGAWFVEDLGSANGTILNRQPVERATALAPGDEVTLSKSTIVFIDDALPATEPGVGARAGEANVEKHTVFLKAADVIPGLAGAYDSRETEETRKLERAEERLALVMEIHQALSRSVDPDELLELILDRAFDHLSPEEGVIFLADGEGGYYRAAHKVVPGASGDYAYTSLLAEVAGNGLATCSLDVKEDERFADAASLMDSGIRSLVAAPLLDEDGTLGMIALSSRLQQRMFDQGDTELLVCLASVAALQIRNATLAEHAAERQRMAHELQLARDIQERLLPESLPDLTGYSMYAANYPSRGVSGDYYNIIPRDDDSECLLLIADVCGKGMAASLLTASLDALAVGPIEDRDAIGDLCRTVARRLYARTPITKYATAIVGSLDVESGVFEYVNAAHNPGLKIAADGTTETLEPAGMPIGVVPDAPYEAQAVTLAPGDVLVLYTDGLTEALDPDDEEYGEERLTRVCVDHRYEELPKLATLLDDDIETFVRGVPYRDDRTIILLRRSE